MQTTIHNLPDHQAIDASDIEPFVAQMLEAHQREVDVIVDAARESPTWDNLVMPMETLSVELNDAWAPIAHLNSVVSNDTLREAHDHAIRKLSEHSTRLNQSRPLYDAYENLAAGNDFQDFDATQRKIVDDTLRTFRRNGVALADEERERFKELAQRLTELSSQFSNNLLDATDAWSKQIQNVSELDGLPESSLAVAKAAAAQKGLEGHLLTLDMACYTNTMVHCTNRPLREEMYVAFVTRASDVGPNADEFDNAAIVQEILSARTEMAQLVGFENYAEYSIDPKMAGSADEVTAFLEDLLARALPQARDELQQMQEFAKESLGYDTLEPWDRNFVAERMRKDLFEVSENELKPYFPLDRVVSGMFAVVEDLFDVSIKRLDVPSGWHDDVRYYEIARDDAVIARFYLDAFAREKKRGGAWMADCRSRRAVGNELSLPVAYLTCNFTPPADGKPSLLTHSEVITLFHEFGHGLHHMLTQQPYATVSGINGVEWDAIELPSQFMENWCWQAESLKRVSGHYKTDAPLPSELLDRLIAAKNFNSGLAMVRQLEFGLFDMSLHTQTEHFDPLKTMRELRARIDLHPDKEYDRFPYGFGHIFAGGYAAGYYSYLWAEVLSSDAFAAFEEEGLGNQTTSKRFLNQILEVGSSVKANEMFASFRGRAPQSDALLRHSGIRSSES